MKKIIKVLWLCLLIGNTSYAQMETQQDGSFASQQGKQLEEPTLPATEEQLDVRAIIPAVSTINIDGQADDWADVPVFITDREKDVRTQYVGEEVCEFDVKEIKFARDGLHLLILIELASELGYYFNTNKERSKVIGTIFLDTDDNKSSGGEEFYSKLGGFESKIDVWSGVKIKGGGPSVAGNTYLSNPHEAADLEYFLEYIPSKFDQAKNSLSTDFTQIVRSDEKASLITYSNNNRFIELKIPFVDLNIHSENNKTIRVLFSEYGSGTWGCGIDTFSEEATGTME